MRGPTNILLSNLHESTENLLAGRSPSVGVLTPAPPDAANTSDDGDRDSDLDIDLEELHGDGDGDGDDADDDTGASSNLLNGSATLKHRALSSPQAVAPSTSTQHRRRTYSTTSQPLDPAAHQRALLQCLLLEAGILFHSIFIGMALSVSTGPPFVVLLIAISFHQTFEGLALGSRIAALHFPPSSPQPWLMALAYGTTTPLGQALGLALHSLYDPASQTGLLVVGITNAVSSGLLLFAGLVELLAEDFLSVASYKSLRGRRRLEASGAVVAGALLMALVGAWA